LVPTLPWFLWIAVAALALDVIKLKVLWRQSIDPAPARGTYIPPHDLYQVWMPIILALLLATRDVWFLSLLLLQVLLFYRDIRRREVLQVIAQLCQYVIGVARAR